MGYQNHKQHFRIARAVKLAQFNVSTKITKTEDNAITIKPPIILNEFFFCNTISGYDFS